MAYRGKEINILLARAKRSNIKRKFKKSKGILEPKKLVVEP